MGGGAPARRGARSRADAPIGARPGARARCGLARRDAALWRPGQLSADRRRIVAPVARPWRVLARQPRSARRRSRALGSRRPVPSTARSALRPSRARRGAILSARVKGVCVPARQPRDRAAGRGGAAQSRTRQGTRGWLDRGAAGGGGRGGGEEERGRAADRKGAGERGRSRSCGRRRRPWLVWPFARGLCLAAWVLDSRATRGKREKGSGRACGAGRSFFVFFWGGGLLLPLPLLPLLFLLLSSSRCCGLLVRAACCACACSFPLNPLLALSVSFIRSFSSASPPPPRAYVCFPFPFPLRPQLPPSRGRAPAARRASSRAALLGRAPFRRAALRRRGLCPAGPPRGRCRGGRGFGCWRGREERRGALCPSRRGGVFFFFCFFFFCFFFSSSSSSDGS